MTADVGITSSQDSGPDDRTGFFRQFVALAGPFWSTGRKWEVRGLTALLVALTILQVVSPILINLWSANLFNALEQRSMDRFMAQIGALMVILLFAMTVASTHMWVKRKLQVKWRKWLTRRVLDDWMAEGRHYQITHIPGEHDNPDGRIAEDIRNATESAIDLAHSLTYCLLLLISFTQILWSLSGIITLPLGGSEIQVPGHMVFVSLLYATAGTTAAVLLGQPLVRTVNKRQTVEANFRFGLVRVRENSESIALVHGEPDERRRLSDLFANVIGAWDRQTRALVHIFLFSSGYQVLATGFPILIAAPRYIAGAITLGALMQIAQAFQQMTSALSWPVDNLSKAAEWKASVERVLSIDRALQELAAHALVCHEDRNICPIRSDSDTLRFEGLTITSPDGQAVVSGIDAVIAKGERVLITGDPDAAIKLFKVAAGLWPWGSGRVALPADANIFFMPQRPYLPIARLRSVLAYPKGPDSFDDATLTAALERVTLSHLIPRLDDTATWEHTLTLGEQQRLGFARLLLQRPDWIFIEEATAALLPEGERQMMTLATTEFPGATVLTVGYHSALEEFHQRKLELVPLNDGQVAMRETRLKIERRREMSSLDLRNWLVHPLRRAAERKE
ncbi:ABC transporter ATP-binding protein/permease [Magnetospirillum sp. UT-4]|uniref:ABC transporter ATP-binding protein/permease n=1 Tax=Magnetospirillum sp. UT-4 TaxID=2681467 RepID=UPI0013825AD7|nr:ABC transporter ATP-binding protein/permease [Magnetospirillum sp. UT-4]CAA7619791.1 ABC transporter, ATP-binding protein [Magnetospirillum sp. UT-4]